MRPREDLGGAVIQLDAPAPLAIVTRIRPTPSGGAGCEDLIRKVIEAAAKEGASIYTEGVACIQEAQTELSVLREDLSNLA